MRTYTLYKQGDVSKRLSLKTWAQFENLGELVKNTIFVA